MKKLDFDKAVRIICIISVAALVFLYFNSRSRKSAENRQSIQDALLSMAEDLHELSTYAEDSQDYGYEDMQISLYHLQEECQKLSEKADDLSRLFEEPEYEENRRSWFY